MVGNEVTTARVDGMTKHDSFRRCGIHALAENWGKMERNCYFIILLYDMLFG